MPSRPVRLARWPLLLSLSWTWSLDIFAKCLQHLAYLESDLSMPCGHGRALTSKQLHVVQWGSASMFGDCSGPCETPYPCIDRVRAGSLRTSVLQWAVSHGLVLPNPAICHLSPRRAIAGTRSAALCSFSRCARWRPSSWLNSSTTTNAYGARHKAHSVWSSSNPSAAWQVSTTTPCGSRSLMRLAICAVMTVHSTSMPCSRTSSTRAHATVVLPEPGGPSKARMRLCRQQSSRTYGQTSWRALSQDTCKSCLDRISCWILLHYYKL